MVRFDQFFRGSRLGICLLIGVAFGLAGGQAEAVAKPLTIKSAAYNKKKGLLKVITSTKNLSGNLTLLHGSGGILAEQGIAGKKQSFAIPLAQLGQVPCEVEARVGDQRVVKKVAGAPPDCKKMPVCQILSPKHGQSLTVNTPFEFKGQAKLKDKKATGEPTYEWDFGGGVMGVPIGSALTGSTLRPTTLSGTTQFVRDNSYYRIRFAATDSNKHRCEAAVEVKVGTPPGGLPAKVAEASAPKRGGALPDAQQKVVIPFQEWSMQHFTDMRVQPNGYISFDAVKNNLNAYVFEKGSVGTAKPKFLSADSVTLQYSAGSNPYDPAGANSINSTSQNWPLNADPAKPAPLMTATVQKSDYWEEDIRSATDVLCKCYDSEPWIQFFGTELWMTALPGTPKPDEGYFPHVNLDRSAWLTAADWAPYAPDFDDAVLQDLADSYAKEINRHLALEPADVTHGRSMPGIDNPYFNNVPQAMPKFDADRQWHSATLIPITDISDDGRVNPYPLLRVEAVQKNTQTVVAATDGVLSNSRDFHCRECHAKGQIAANPNAGYKKEAFRSSPSGMAGMHGTDTTPPLDRPNFFSVEDIGGKRGNLFDEEYAAALNYSSVHQFYDGMGFLDHMQKGGINEKTGLVGNDWPAPCFGCHMSALQWATTGGDWWSSESYDYTARNYDPNYSIAMHRFHAEMQFNADKTDIVRNDKGGYQRFDWKGKPRVANKDINPNTLFPIFDASGNQLPMEQNCLKCHAGHREPMYNDRMKTAGVTCYDCHGDMLAVGQAYPKDIAKAGSNDHHDYRIPWFDETDCGSCHVGTGNVGKQGTNGFFSAGIKRRAFDDADPAAITRPVDQTNPDAIRFAVVPNYVKEFTTSATRYDPTAAGADDSGNVTDANSTKVNAPVYRFGKDQHGNVACAACHGAAHSIGPNRDPKANDNLTAIQLQGYPGQIFECNVCHTKDAFNTEDSIGSFLHYPNGKDEKPTILAGPHNMHPVNDPNWYLKRAGGEPNATDGSFKGGWHTVWAGKPGLKGEDQCAACHGEDHKGTRLSKVPVDRVLIAGKSKHYKKITVKAGTPIACDLCHSLEQSFSKKPAGPVAARHAPVISTDPAPVAIVGQAFSYQLTATDAEGGSLSFDLISPPEGMSIDGNGWVTSNKVPENISQEFSFLAQVTDATGLTGTHWFTVNPVCPVSAQYWDVGLSLCTPLKINSSPDVLGLDAGATFTYQVTANPSTGVSFSLKDPPPELTTLTIGAATGLLTWVTDANSPDSQALTILADDGQGHQASQDITVTVCKAPKHWDPTMHDHMTGKMGMCM